MVLEEFDSKGMDFGREICPDFQDIRLMLWYLLGEVCVVALRDGMEYHESMVKQMPYTTWLLDDIKLDLLLATDQFNDIIDSQQWERVEDLAEEIFNGKLGLKSLPLNEAERMLIGAKFTWLCGDSQELVDRYMLPKIRHPIYNVSRGRGLLKNMESHCGPSPRANPTSWESDPAAEPLNASPRATRSQNEGHSHQERQPRDKSPSLQGPTQYEREKEQNHQYTFPSRQRDPRHRNGHSLSTCSHREETPQQTYNWKQKSPESCGGSAL